MTTYIFWSDAAGKRAIIDGDDGDHAMSIAASLEDEWHTDDVEWDIASEDEQNDRA